MHAPVLRAKHVKTSTMLVSIGSEGQDTVDEAQTVACQTCIATSRHNITDEIKLHTRLERRITSMAEQMDSRPAPVTYSWQSGTQACGVIILLHRGHPLSLNSAPGKDKERLTHGPAGSIQGLARGERNMPQRRRPPRADSHSTLRTSKSTGPFWRCAASREPSRHTPL